MDASSLRSLGVLVIEGFLGRDACRRLVRSMEGAPRAPFAHRDARQEDVRRASRVLVERPPDVRGRYRAPRPRLASALGAPVSRSGESYVLEYREGDYCRPHFEDEVPDGPRRLVATSLLLNQDYRGEGLVLHGLLGKQAPWDRCALPVPAAEGTLVAFLSTTVHEVTPVQAGRRLSLVHLFC